MKKLLLLSIMAIALLSACDTNSIKSKVWHEMSRESLKQDSLENALVLVNLAIGADSTNIDHYFLKAMVASKLHHIDLLNEQVGRLKQNNYKQDSLYYYIGECYACIDKDSIKENGNHTNKLKLAIGAYKQCLSLNQNFEQAYEALLLAEYNSQQYDALKETCTKAIALFPSNPIFKVYQGASLMMEMKIDESKAALNEAIASGKLDNIYQSRCYRLLAFNAMNFDELENAIAPMNKAVETAPKDYLNYVARAGLFADLDEQEQACKDFEKAFDLGYMPAADSMLKYCPSQTVSDN